MLENSLVDGTWGHFRLDEEWGYHFLLYISFSLSIICLSVYVCTYMSVYMYVSIYLSVSTNTHLNIYLCIIFIVLYL